MGVLDSVKSIFGKEVAHYMPFPAKYKRECCV